MDAKPSVSVYAAVSGPRLKLGEENQKRTGAKEGEDEIQAQMRRKKTRNKELDG